MLGVVDFKSVEPNVQKLCLVDAFVYRFAAFFSCFLLELGFTAYFWAILLIALLFGVFSHLHVSPLRGFDGGAASLT